MTENLFDKYGGAGFWRELAASFHAEIQDRRPLARNFVKADVGEFVECQTGFLAVVIGGASQEVVPPKCRKLDQDDFEELVDVFADVMDDFGVAEDDQEMLANAILKRSGLLVA